VYISQLFSFHKFKKLAEANMIHTVCIRSGCPEN
jgi:hypothetical protein